MGNLHQWLFVLLIFGKPLHCCTTKVMLDMTYEYEENKTAYWPTDNPRLKLQEVFVGDAGSHWYELYKFSTVDHAGTHIDAPSHFSQGGTTVDQISIDKLVVPAVVIDISHKAKYDADAQLTITDIKKWEDIYGAISKKSVVLMNSGWGERYSNKTAYFGTASDDVTKLHFPGFHEDAAKWLIHNRDINGIGVDTPSIDSGQSHEFLTHIAVLTREKYGLENVKNVDKIPVRGATLYVMPMKIAGAGGAPTRVMAMWHKRNRLG